MNMFIVTAIVAITLYVTTTALLGYRLANGVANSAHNINTPIIVVSLAVLLHAAFLYQGIIADDGLKLGFFNALSLLGWTISLVLLIGALFEPVLNIGIAMFPGTAITLLLMLIFPAEQVTPLQGGWPIQAHVLLSIVAYSLFALAAVQVILLTLQDRALRKHKTTGFTRALPPLQTMEALLFQMLALGFVLLSFALLTGAFYISDMFAQHLIHKTILSIISWLVFGILLWGRWKFGWRGQKALTWTLGGFVALGLAYPVTKFILEVILGRSWS